MFQTIAFKACAVWVGILVLAIANGALREGFLIPKLGKAPGMVLSGILLSAIILWVAYLSLPWIGARFPRQLVLIGVGWVLLTLAFEISFGMLRGQSMAELLEAYTFKGGNIWPLVLLVAAAAPYLAAKLRGIPIGGGG
ncbi:MAG TPA: hypothetical protein VKA13_06905 [Gammaproteobacteria bacterium]|nr:hypothetical protein [Gammaproteobacteria bacterium]